MFLIALVIAKFSKNFYKIGLKYMKLNNLKISFKKADSFKMKTGVNEITLENVDEGNIELLFDEKKIYLKENLHVDGDRYEERQQIQTTDDDNQTKEILSKTDGENEPSLDNDLTSTADDTQDIMESDAKNQPEQTKTDFEDKHIKNTKQTKPTTEKKKTNTYYNNLFGTILFIGFEKAFIKDENLKEFIDKIKNICLENGGNAIELLKDKDIVTICSVFGNNYDFTHAIKAIQTALRIKNFVGIKFADNDKKSQHNPIKTGIDTGKLASLSPTEKLSPGSHNSTAFQLMKMSRHGETLISNKTSIFTKGIFDITKKIPNQKNDMQYKGDVFVVNGRKSHPYLIRPSLLGDTEIPFIGSNNNFLVLKDIWEKVYKNKQSHLITISGIANSGKTRIVEEFLKNVESKNIDINLYHNLGSYQDDKTIPMKVFKNIFFRTIFHNETIKNKNIKQYIKSILQGKIQKLDESIDIVLSFLGIGEPETETQKSHIEDAKNLEIRAFYLLKTILESIAEDVPIIIIIDDLQWVDEQSLRFIEYLNASIKNKTFLIICITRPIFFNTHQDWGKYKSNYNYIELTHLTSSERLDFTQKLLHKIDDVPADLVHKIANTSNGNPSHIIEIVNLLIEQNLIMINENEDIWYPDIKGIKNYPFPSSLDYTVLVRYENLSSNEKEFLTIASSIGTQFDYYFLNNIFNFNIDTVLIKLINKSFIHFQVDNTLDIKSNTILQFTSHYIRDSIYRTITKKNRVDAHVKIYKHLTEELEKTNKNNLDLLIKTATQLLHIGGRDKAVHLLIQSADMSMKVGSRLSALNIYNKISSVVNLHKHSDIATELYTNRGNILLEIGNYLESARNFDALINISDKNGDDISKCYAMTMLSVTFEKLNDLDRSYEYARTALSLAERIENPKLKSIANMCLGKIFEKRGQLDYAEEYFNRTEVLMRTIDDKKGISDLLQALGRINYTKENYKKAISLYQKAIDINERLENNSLVCSLIMSCAEVNETINHLDEALGMYKKALKLSEAIGDRIQNAQAFEKCASLLVEKGQDDEALTYYFASVEIKIELNDKKSLARIYSEMGKIYKKSGKLRKSTEYFDKSLDIHNELDNKKGMAENLKYIADIYKKKENYRSAIKCYEKSIEIMEQIQYNKGLEAIYKELGDIYRQTGDNVKAVEYRAKITQLNKKKK